jgi:hypothetical protein
VRYLLARYALYVTALYLLGVVVHTDRYQALAIGITLGVVDALGSRIDNAQREAGYRKRAKGAIDHTYGRRKFTGGKW